MILLMCSLMIVRVYHNKSLSTADALALLYPVLYANVVEHWHTTGQGIHITYDCSAAFLCQSNDRARMVPLLQWPTTIS